MQIHLLELEGEVSSQEIQIFSDKIVGKSGKIEPKLFALNDAKHKLSPQDLTAFE